MQRKKGIIILLVGIGLLMTSLLMASGHNKNVGLITNISRMDIVFVKGEYIMGYGESALERMSDAYWEGRIAIPLKVCLVLSVVVILAGTGMVLLASKENHQQ